MIMKYKKLNKQGAWCINNGLNNKKDKFWKEESEVRIFNLLQLKIIKIKSNQIIQLWQMLLMMFMKNK